MPPLIKSRHNLLCPCNQTRHDAGFSSAAENEASSLWRPAYHLAASGGGFMNDPCAPGYIPSRDLYHVGFQWNPKAAEWADIVWGKAFSRDLVTWDVSGTPSLERDAPYDRAGIFTGCLTPTHHLGSPDEPTIFYTSVTRVPIHYAQEYHYGSETLSLASSWDGGETWHKHQDNPILPGPPPGFHATATGWRDPFVAPWPTMDSVASSVQGREPGGGPSLFGIISGGVRHTSPTTWLYRIDAKDLTKWEFIAPLIMPGLNFSPSRWTGDSGVNWEVTNFMSLGADGHGAPQDFLIFGAEGCKPPHGGAGIVQGTPRCNRAVLWMAIDVAGEARQDKSLMEFSYGGILDHGLLYAANGFWDPVLQRQIVIGWVTEEDLPVERQLQQGWSGCLSLPRNVSLATIHHVSRASKSALGDITSIRACPEEEDGNLCTVQTLKITPDARLEQLRPRAVRQDCEGGLLGPGKQPRRLPLKTAEWEACAQFSSVGSSGRTGLAVHHASADQKTVLYFSPADETFHIDRPDLCYSTTPPCGTETEMRSAKLQGEKAPFTLFTTRDPQTGIEAEEQLKIHAYYDRSVLEVFVNERAVITTRVYLDAAECTGLEFFAESEGVVLVDAVVWDGLCNNPSIRADGRI